MQNIVQKNISLPNTQNLDQSIQKKSAPVKAPLFFVSVLGTVLEYFEYAIYGFLAPILALHFFPEGDSTAALLKTFGVFAVGSLSKPLGALIFGYLGDREGRRISLRYSMIGISFPTFVVGILPGYASWGWGAAFGLVLCRMLQGMFVAGESDGVRIYVFEHYGIKHPCLITTLVGCGAYIGIALASLVASQISPTGNSWRLVFLGCSVFGVLVFILRRYLIETPPFLAYQSKHLFLVPLRQLLKTHWRALLRTLMICGAGGGAYHFHLVFQGTYLSKILGLVSFAEMSLHSFWLTTVYILTLPFAGWAADRWGLVQIAKMGGCVTLSLVTLEILLIFNKVAFFPLMICTTISMAFLFTPGYLFLIQHYDVGIRFRGLSLGHAIGSMLFSGTTPFMCLLLWQNTMIPYVPYVYFLCLIIMGMSAFIWGERDLKIQPPPE